MVFILFRFVPSELCESGGGEEEEEEEEGGGGGEDAGGEFHCRRGVNMCLGWMR